MVKSRGPFLSILSLGVFVYFLKRNLAYLYPRRFSQITHYLLYLTEAVLICRNSQAFLPCIYCLIKTGSEEKNAILLDQRLWKLKTCQILLAYCLLEGPWAIIFFLFSLSFFYRWIPRYHEFYCRTLVHFFCEVVEHLLIIISSKYPYFCIAHASNAIILWKSESF